MQKICDDFQNNSNKSDSSSHMLNRFFCQQQQQHQSRNSSPQSQQIEIDVNSLNFSYIAEGCRDTRSFQIKEFFHQQQPYILIEINESSLKIKNCSNENETRFKLSKIFSLSNRENELSRFIKLDSLNGRTHEINFHIDTQDLNLLKDNCKNLKLHLKPLEISLNLTISSCMENFNINQPQQQKSILKQILVNFNLGYVRLKTNEDFNAIDFVIMKKIYKNHVEYEMEESQTKNLVSISNAGNVPIKLKCYLLDKNINDKLKTHSIRVNSEFISFDEFSTHKNLDVVLEKKLAHESTLNCNQENLNTALIVEVLPNGIKYEIPIKIEIKEVNMEPIITTKAQSIRILASTTFIQFGACNIDDYLVQDLILQNSNDLKR
jgi:hypothetical protein